MYSIQEALSPLSRGEILTGTLFKFIKMRRHDIYQFDELRNIYRVLPVKFSWIVRNLALPSTNRDRNPWRYLTDVGCLLVQCSHELRVAQVWFIVEIYQPECRSMR